MQLLYITLPPLHSQFAPPSHNLCMQPCIGIILHVHSQWRTKRHNFFVGNVVAILKSFLVTTFPVTSFSVSEVYTIVPLTVLLQYEFHAKYMYVTYNVCPARPFTISPYIEVHLVVEAETQVSVVCMGLHGRMHTCIITMYWRAHHTRTKSVSHACDC